MEFASVRPLGWRKSTVLSWAGMRGVVTLAVALSLPTAMPGRDLMLITAFAVIFVTVVVQGATLGWVIERLRPEDPDPAARMCRTEAEAAVARARADMMEARLRPRRDAAASHPARAVPQASRARPAAGGGRRGLLVRLPAAFRHPAAGHRRRPHRTAPHPPRRPHRGRRPACAGARPRYRGVGHHHAAGDVRSELHVAGWFPHAS